MIAENRKLGSLGTLEAGKWERGIRSKFMGLGETSGEMQGSREMHALDDELAPIEKRILWDGGSNPMTALGQESRQLVF